MTDVEEAIARLKANSGYDRDTQRARDIRALVEALESVQSLVGNLESVQWEYGTRWHIKGDPKALFPEYRKDRVVEFVEDSREEALDIIEQDRVAMKLEGTRGILIRRIVFDSAWEEVK